ncbi:MAG: glutathione peroxidase [Myxococcota bacterium]|nr:glutathione peroxidase [Myxococcota bacterium]MDW8362787.1 glutathione peroxidase [Myxococcales bacterium]
MNASTSSAHDFTLPALRGGSIPLSRYAGKALLVVNVASRCGLTPQYAALQALYARRANEGLEVIGVPCNQFGAQEPGTEDEIASFCSTNYNVTFPLAAKLDVNGPGRHPLFAWLCGQSPGPEPAGDVTWNFTKFVIDRAGRLVARFAPPVSPDSPEVQQAIDRALRA